MSIEVGIWCEGTIKCFLYVKVSKDKKTMMTSQQWGETKAAYCSLKGVMAVSYNVSKDSV